MYDRPFAERRRAADPGKPQQTARTAALHLLASRPRTTSEMTERLANKFGQDEAERAVEGLLAEGLLNDLEFARQWRDSRERNRPRSRGMLAWELRQRGVEDGVVDEALAGFDSAGSAYRAAWKFASRQTGADAATFHRRVGGFLQRRGFGPEEIRSTIQLLREELSIEEQADSGYGA